MANCAMMVSMKVSGGKFKNHALRAPKGLSTRPSTGRVRESLFNICQFSIEGCAFLDLFSGSGMIGIEALSRGAAKATFVESGKEALLCIKENLKKLKLENQALVISGDALKVSKKLEGYDIIFADPPYALESMDELIQIMDDYPVLNGGGILFIETGKSTRFTLKESSTLVLEKTRSYGNTTLHQFIKTQIVEI